MPKGYPKAKAPQINGKPISKMEAMRQVFDAYGTDIKPLEIQRYMKQSFGIDMDTKVISSYKTTITSKKKGKKGKRKMTAEAGMPATASASVSRAGGITLDDIRAVKELANRIGAEKVRQLAEVLAK